MDGEQLGFDFVSTTNPAPSNAESAEGMPPRKRGRANGGNTSRVASCREPDPGARVVPAAPAVRGDTQRALARREGGLGALVVQAAPGVRGDTQQAAARLTELLSARLRRPVRLFVTDNRRTMVSARSSRERMEVRVHHMFLAADAATIDALARYLCDRERSAGKVLDAYVERHRARIRGATSRPAPAPRSAGAHHDLRAMFTALESAYFPGAMDDVRITWARRMRGRHRQRSLQLGTYVVGEQLIRIHPVLDQEWVPRFYVGSVVFHEMLHHVMPPVRVAGRMRYHPPEFRRRERTYAHHEAAERWEKANLTRLLRSMR